MLEAHGWEYLPRGLAEAPGKAELSPAAVWEATSVGSDAGRATDVWHCRDLLPATKQRALSEALELLALLRPQGDMNEPEKEDI